VLSEDNIAALRRALEQRASAASKEMVWGRERG
jgi:hypothetical protein